MQIPQQTLSVDVMSLFRPLIRLLLRHGVSYDAFADLAKKEYMDVAMNDFGIRVVDERRRAQRAGGAAAISREFCLAELQGKERIGEKVSMRYGDQQ